MVLRTLHFYIFRELLRNFALTAVALTTLMAFGGTFKPLTKEGIEVGQLMVIIINLMPAMLGYAIPIAALFASVLVYWRMSTDNELTACRAGGISFLAIVMPAFVLGLVVASVDLWFVNYLVPRYWHKTERAVMRDLGSLLVGQINHQEKFEYPGWGVVYADRAEQEPSDDPDASIVRLHGMAFSMLKNNKPMVLMVAREATARITNLRDQDAARIDISVSDGSAFDPGNAFRRVSGSITDVLPEGRPFIVPSQLKSKPKFLNWKQLGELKRNPTIFPPVEEILQKIRDARRNQVIDQHIVANWKTARAAGKPLEFQQSSVGTAGTNTIRIIAQRATFDEKAPPEQAVTFAGTRDAPVQAEIYSQGKLQSTYTCDAADVQLNVDEFYGTGVGATLELHDNVMRRDHVHDIKATPAGTTMLSGILLDAATQTVTDINNADLLAYAKNNPQEALKKQSRLAESTIDNLYQKIYSELHSRGSFSLACLTLVLLGAALGILLRGKNPLAVFVLGFVPAIVLVLLITAGRQLAEGNPRNMNFGLVMIWAGNFVILALVAGVYAKLLRH